MCIYRCELRRRDFVNYYWTVCKVQSWSRAKWQLLLWALELLSQLWRTGLWISLAVYDNMSVSKNMEKAIVWYKIVSIAGEFKRIYSKLDLLKIYRNKIQQFFSFGYSVIILLFVSCNRKQFEINKKLRCIEMGANLIIQISLIFIDFKMSLKRATWFLQINV